jgi:hypothetical protein
MNSAVIGEDSNGPKCHGKGEPVIVYARIKYSIRAIRNTGSHAVIVAGPSPVDDIADLDDDRARVEVGTALSHANVSRSGGSQEWQPEQKRERQSEIHFADSCAGAHRGRHASTEHVCRNSEQMNSMFLQRKGPPSRTIAGPGASRNSVRHQSRAFPGQ